MNIEDRATVQEIKTIIQVRHGKVLTKAVAELDRRKQV